MSLGPYASFIVTAEALVALVLAILIGWIAIDYRRQKARLIETRNHDGHGGPMTEVRHVRC